MKPRDPLEWAGRLGRTFAEIGVACQELPENRRAEVVRTLEHVADLLWAEAPGLPDRELLRSR